MSTMTTADALKSLASIIRKGGDGAASSSYDWNNGYIAGLEAAAKTAEAYSDSFRYGTISPLAVAPAEDPVDTSGQDICYLFRSPQQRDDWKRINHRHQGRAASIWESAHGERFQEVRVMFTPETEQEHTALNDDWRTRLRPGGLWVPYPKQEG